MVVGWLNKFLHGLGLSLMSLLQSLWQSLLIIVIVIIMSCVLLSSVKSMVSRVLIHQVLITSGWMEFETHLCEEVEKHNSDTSKVDFIQM